VKHVLTAVGSRTVESAEKFIGNVCPDKDLAAKVQPFASYQGVYDCPEVDVVYIGRYRLGSRSYLRSLNVIISV
jgi:hypothetical protein